jgi:cytochrome c oxidase subunit 2
VIDPAGPAAALIARLWWVLFAIGTVVVVLVVAALLYGGRHRRPEDRDPSEERERRSVRLVVLAGAIVPAVVLAGVFLYTVATLGALSRPVPADLVVEVTGRQFWWQLTYLDPEPSRRFETANELHIPVGRRVALRLRSSDVIHSFWVPELQGKMDHVPGRTNELWLEASRPGVYRGRCAEFCGVQHAKMRFLVIAQPVEEFERWAERQRRPSAEPASPAAARGRDVFLSSPCVGCHTVRGTLASGVLGPDLTHLASRRTIAAGILPNVRGALGGWIANSQAIKPGNRMPGVPLPPDDLQALLTYLQSLE